MSFPNIRDKFFSHNGIWYFNGIEVPDPTAEIEPQPSTMMDKVGGLAGAIFSKVIEPPATTTAQAIRIATCNSCEHLMRSSDAKQFGHCRACGCGVHKLSALTFKATIARSTCVKNKWCDADGNPPSTPPPAT